LPRPQTLVTIGCPQVRECGFPHLLGKEDDAIFEALGVVDELNGDLGNEFGLC